MDECKFSLLAAFYDIFDNCPFVNTLRILSRAVMFQLLNKSFSFAQLPFYYYWFIGAIYPHN